MVVPATACHYQYERWWCLMVVTTDRRKTAYYLERWDGRVRATTHGQTHHTTTTPPPVRVQDDPTDSGAGWCYVFLGTGRPLNPS